ncbi:hypothetical protein DL95DRAFT_411100 [Leptodontidium sp. 2 PMI_412]|nr:hypothetical protein DL95DRAFT_411100 [Leptodontidium sp. 2 PMI_412]
MGWMLGWIDRGKRGWVCSAAVPPKRCRVGIRRNRNKLRDVSFSRRFEDALLRDFLLVAGEVFDVDVVVPGVIVDKEDKRLSLEIVRLSRSAWNLEGVQGSQGRSGQVRYAVRCGAVRYAAAVTDRQGCEGLVSLKVCSRLSKVQGEAKATASSTCSPASPASPAFNPLY